MKGKALKISVLLLFLASSVQAGAADVERLRLVTTTSLYDTGLLDLIEDRFEERYDVSLDVVSKGTGIAIQLAERGDADVLMVHDKAREVKFVDEGYGIERRCIAYNYFTIVGPADDPAGIKGLAPDDAMARIEEIGSQETGTEERGTEGPDEVKFVSRGDSSGTHAREGLLWKAAGYNISELDGDWYIESGSGMGATLVMADQEAAYTLSDMSTFLAYQGDLDLVPLVDQGDLLLNVYVAIAVNPEKHPGVNCEMANNFIDYLISDEGQEIIAEYGTEEFGRPLFFKASGNCDLIGCSEEECATPASGCPAAAA